MSISDVISKSFLKYLFQRLGQCVLVIFIGITVTFLIPRLAPTNPVEQKINQMMTGPANIHPEAIKAFRESMNDLYGLKGSIGEQYINFWKRFLRGDLGPSLFSYPHPVTELIWRSMPWTIGLLLTTSLLSWIIGNLLGGLAGYYSEKRWTKWVELAANCVRPIPYYIFAFILLIIFCFLIPIFPTSGAYAPGVKEGWNVAFVLSVLYHTFLPALSLVVTSLGAWLLGMRSLVSNKIGRASCRERV
jgi:peptide/nickel transport system permease protein